MQRSCSSGRTARAFLLALAFLAGTRPDASAQIITEYPIQTADSNPSGIATGPDGAVWFTEFWGNRIGRITTAGVVSEFAIPTSNSAPADIAAGPEGALWFTEDFAGKVGRITIAGEITEFKTGAFAINDGTVGIARGPDDNMWFTEWDAGLIGRITPAGVITLFTIPDPPMFGAKPNDIVAGPDGALWFTEVQGNKIGRITTGGVITQFAIPTAASAPLSITASPDGNVWFTEASANKIGRITTGGVITEFSIPTASSWPYGITAGQDGALWFTESGANKIGRITTEGIITEFPIPTVASSPAGITAGPDGNVWFTEASGNKIGRITVDRLPALETRILPVVGSTPGANGTFFRTSVQLHNPGSASIAGRIVFHPSGLSGSDSDPALFYSLAPGQTQSFADLLPVMGLSGVGSADVEATLGSEPVTTVRVFNDAGPSGTTGLTEEPMRADEALGAGQNAVLLIPSDLATFRFNLGVRTLDSGASMTLTVRDASGAVVATVPRSFPETYHLQREASEFLEGVALPAGGSVAVAVESGSAILYGATVDNSTGDPSLQIARVAQ